MIRRTRRLGTEVAARRVPRRWDTARRVGPRSGVSRCGVTNSWWWSPFLGTAIALLAGWFALVAVLVLVRPRGRLLAAGLRLLPDLLRLVRRLAADRTLPAGIRIRLGLLLAYLAMPIDLIPDVIPVLGYADDVIVVLAVLRSVIRHAGRDAVRRHWPGTDDGFAALIRITGLANPADDRT